MTMERILKQNDSRITLFILYEVQPAKKFTSTRQTPANGNKDQKQILWEGKD